MCVEAQFAAPDRRRLLNAGTSVLAVLGKLAPRDIPHQLRNPGDIANHYLIVFSPSGFEEFLKVTAVPAPVDAAAPTEPPAVAVRNVHDLAARFSIPFG